MPRPADGRLAQLTSATRPSWFGRRFDVPVRLLAAAARPALRRHHASGRRHGRPRVDARLHAGPPAALRSPHRMDARLVRRLPRGHLLLPASDAADRAARRVSALRHRLQAGPVLGSGRPAARRLGLRPPVGDALPRARLPGGGHPAVPVRPDLHHLRRQHPLDAGGRVRVLDLAWRWRCSSSAWWPRASTRAATGPGRGAARADGHLPSGPGRSSRSSGVGVLLLFRAEQGRLKWVIPVGTVGGLLAAFWVIPFLARLAYTNDMGWEKLTDYRASGLQVDEVRWVPVLGRDRGAGIDGRGVVGRDRPSRSWPLRVGAGFAPAPQSGCGTPASCPSGSSALYLLAGVAVAEVARAVRWVADRLGGPSPHALPGVARPMKWLGPTAKWFGPTAMVDVPDEFRCRRGTTAGPAVMTTVAAARRGAPPSSSTCAHRRARGGVDLRRPAAGCAAELDGFPAQDRSFIPDWVRWNYSGYERKRVLPGVPGPGRDDGQPRPARTAAVAPCGSTSRSSTASARRWR